MTTLRKLDDWLVGRVAFPLTSYMMNRRAILQNYEEMLKSEWQAEDSLRAMQLSKLQSLISYAYDHCPFYTHKFKSIGLKPIDIRSLEDMKYVPPLSREEAITHSSDLLDQRFRESVVAAEQSIRGPGQPLPFGRFAKRKLVRNSSSGSTGAPVVFYEDGSITAVNWAFELRLRHWFGFEPGVREARMARVSADYVPNTAMNWARRNLWHQLMLPGVNLRDKDYALALSKIRDFKPEVLWGFTSALAGLADYIRRTGEDVHSCSPKLAIGWAAPVYDHEEQILKEVFNCKVSNIYGAREVGHVAALCPEHTWHINQEHVLLETHEGGPGAEKGEVLVTPLTISPMPFIRYRLGDLGRPAVSDCRCGRKLSVLKDFLGRTGEVFVTKDGNMIAPNFWCRFFMVDGQSRFVERFQVIYKKSDLVTIRIVKRAGFSESTEADMSRILKKNFTPDVHFNFEYVSEIKPQISGKYQMVINETRN